jgi:hypothetical protein
MADSLSTDGSWKDKQFDPFETARTHARVVFVRRMPKNAQGAAEGTAEGAAEGTAEGAAECAICLSDVLGCSATVYPCGHALHFKCERIFRESSCTTKHRCPTCRRRVRPRSPRFEVRFSDLAFVSLRFDV